MGCKLQGELQHGSARNNHWQGMLAVPVRTIQPELLAEDAAVQVHARVER